MDNYIYFRILDRLAKNGTTLKSDLVYSSGLKSESGALTHLHMIDLIKISSESDKFSTYYKLTEKGIKLHRLMDLFYSTYENMFSMLSKKKLKVKRLHKGLYVHEQIQ